MTTITLATTTLEILPDDCPENPREWDNLGTMVCWHRQYMLGDAHDFCDPRAFTKAVHAGNAVILPVFLFDHSGLTVSFECTTFRACDPQGWDWGQVGFIYATLAAIRREHGVRRISRQVRELATEILRAEVTTYNQFLQGEVFSFVLRDLVTGEVLDACGGFFGENPWTNGMADCLPLGIRDQVLARYRNDAA